jgi:hypothetical protein
VPNPQGLFGSLPQEHHHLGAEVIQEVVDYLESLIG